MTKIAICDDEPAAIQELSNLITLYANEKNLPIQHSAYLSGEQFLADMIGQDKQFDLLFLDIRMQKINGIETAKMVREINESIIIIFVSALHEYVFDAFDVEAKGFLVKPIKKARLYKILDNSFSKLEQNCTCSLNLFQGGEMHKIPFRNIYYCEVQDHFVFVYEKEKIHQYPSKIENLERELNDDFFRCHRSYIVNLHFVDSYRDYMIFMQSGEKIPVAKRRQTKFMKALLHFHRKEVR